MGRKRGSSHPKTPHMALGAIALIIIGFASGEKIDSPIPCRDTKNCTNVPTLPKEAVCRDEYCVCPDVGLGKFRNCSITEAFIDKSKTPGPLIYRTCKVNQDCKYLGGFCNTTNYQCGCLRNYVPSKNKLHCVEKIHSIDSSCEDENQCLAFLANTTCHNNKCVCMLGYRYADNVCWRMVEIGQTCGNPQECSYIENATCTNNATCDCLSGMVLSKDGKRCLGVVQNIRDECTEEVQCMKIMNSACIDTICQCQEGYHYERDTNGCYPSRGLDDICENSYECYNLDDYETDSPIKSVMCDASRCTCAPNYVKFGTHCMSAVGSSFGASLLMIVSLTVLTFHSFLSM